MQHLCTRACLANGLVRSMHTFPHGTTVVTCHRKLFIEVSAFWRYSTSVMLGSIGLVQVIEGLRAFDCFQRIEHK